MGSFETSETHSSRWHQPVRVPTNKGDIFGAAKEMVEDLKGWTLESIDEEALEIRCTRSNGPLGGTSNIVVSVEGPEDIPNSSTHCRSESSGGFLSRDKKNVAEFVQKFWMRVT